MQPQAWREFNLDISVTLMNSWLEQFLDSINKIQPDEELAIVEYKGHPNKDNIQRLAISVRKRGGVDIRQFDES